MKGKKTAWQRREKLYYENGACLQFCATVLSCVPTDGNFAVTLDATAFYPEVEASRRTGEPWAVRAFWMCTKRTV